MKLACMNRLNIVTAAFICTLYFTSANAGEKKHDLLLLEAAENIEFNSQQVAKAYFYKQQGVRPDHAAEDLKRGLALLQDNVIVIQNGVGKDKKEKNIAVFLEYTMNEMKDIVVKPYSRENGALMIDYSESLLEGAEFIIKPHRNKGDAEETMLVAVEYSLFLLERINKFYIAYQAGFRDYNNVIQLKQAVQDFETKQAQINAYTKYSGSTLSSRNKINEFWPVAKEFFVDVQKGALPVIVLASVEKLEKELRVLEDYHHKKTKGDK
ncbi:MAG: hypothetical protein QTN59_07355 [Candidatus Electrothrix communis]|nr:MAG: hypothetical protein QTN59_07355 [Candidatus Electrothrix communis]